MTLEKVFDDDAGFSQPFLAQLTILVVVVVVVVAAHAIVVVFVVTVVVAVDADGFPGVTALAIRPILLPEMQTIAPNGGEDGFPEVALTRISRSHGDQMALGNLRRR